MSDFLIGFGLLLAGAFFGALITANPGYECSAGWGRAGAFGK